MKEYQGEKAIISLTSWKARIKTVGKTIYSLIKQCQGFHIVLVLSEEEFPKKEKELPKDLLILSKYFEILWTKGNLKSHKKYFYTKQKYKDLPIILADDDLLYINDFANKLYNEWLRNKNSIIACRCHEMTFSSANKINPYKNWKLCVKEHKSNKKLFFTTGGGTLLPPVFSQTVDITKADVMKFITADDILLNIKALEYSIEKIHIDCISYIDQNLTENCLWEVNKTKNDEYIACAKDVFMLAYT